MPKKLIRLSALTGLVLSFSIVHAQWTTSGSNIYYNSGNVGIGSSSTPSYKLHVSGTLGAIGNNVLGPINSQYPFKSMLTWESDNSGWYMGIGYQKTDATNQKLHLWWEDSRLETNVNTALNVAVPGHTFDNVAPNTGRVIGARIMSNGDSYFAGGRVGIGTTSPSYKLDIWTTDNVYNARFYQPSSSTSTYNSNLIQGANSPVTGYFGTGGATVSNVHFRDAFVVGTQNNYPLNLNTNDIARVTILGSGNVGIGTSTPQSKLAVNGEIYAKKVKVTQTGWPDFVFNKEYALKPLFEVEAYIIKHKHLPGVPSADDVAKNDLDLGEMNKILLMKVEELTLHLINLEKRENKVEVENARLQQRILTLESQQPK